MDDCEDFSNTLYVIFHGAWAFYDLKSEECIHVYAPDIAEHTYLAGSWLGETKIVQGSTLELDLATPQPGSAGPNERIFDHPEGFVLLPFAHPCPVGAYVEVRLPRPLKIYPEQVIPLTDGQVTIKHHTGGSSKLSNLGLVPVFKYVFQSTPKLQLLPTEEQYWQLPTTNFDRPATLHFFAADDAPKTPKNADDDFAASAALLGIDAELNTKIGGGAKPYDTPIPGLKGREFEIVLPLSTRLDHLRSMGYQMQLGNLTSLNWKPTLPIPRPHPVHIVVSDTSCGGSGGGS